MNEKYNVNQEKNKYGQGMLTGILITVIIGLIAFIIYDKVLSNDNNIEDNKDNSEQVENNNTITEDNNKNVKVTLTESEKEQLLAKIDTYNTDAAITKNYPISDINTLDNNIKLKFLYEKVINSYKESFTDKDLKTVADNYFYNGFSFNNQNIICSVDNEPLYIYNNSTGNYTFNEGYNHGHGGEAYNRTKSYYIDGTYNESTKIYTFDIKVLYGDTCSDMCGPAVKFYDDYQLNNEIYKIGNELEDFDQVYTKVKDKLPITKYNFYKNTNGQFVLKSVEK